MWTKVKDVRRIVMKVINRLFSRTNLSAIFVVLTLALAGCAGTSTSKSTGEFVDDSVLTTKVNAALARDSIMSALAVEVETYRGEVQLSGYVDSEEQIEEVGAIVESVDGVVSVTNSLQVKPSS